MSKKTETPKPAPNPFRGFLDVMSEMNRAQEEWFNRSNSAGGETGRSHAAAYVPPADIFAVDNDLFVRCEVPGVRSHDVSVTVVSNVLTIAGHRDSEIDDADVIYYTRERVYGEFRRTMILPDGVDETAITASVKNGLMEIRVRGGAAAQPRSISIREEDDD